MAKIHDVLLRSETIVVLTGAGVSVSAGIPDFKTAEREWEYERPRNEIFSIPFFRESPERFWEIYRETLTPILEAEKTLFHEFIDQLSELPDKEVMIATQNIDGLHGDEAVELHGSVHRVICVGECLKSGSYKNYPLDEFNEEVPECPECGAILKPDISLFLEGVNGFGEVRDFIADTDLLLVAGTSLDMGPVNELPLYQNWRKTEELGEKIWVNLTPPPEGYEFDHEVLLSTDEFVDRVMNEEL